MGRHRSGSISIDANEVIDQIDDDDLLDECRNRKITPAAPGETVDLDIVREALEALNRNNAAEARSILSRLIFPKWKNPKECEMQFVGRQ